MSRWSKRTAEEKVRIFNEQQEQRKPQSVKAAEQNDKMAVTIYQNGQIPIMCPSCFKWTCSKTYSISSEAHPFDKDKKIPMICGHCAMCNRRVRRAFPQNIDEIPLFTMTCVKLQHDGALIDLR